MHEIQRIRKIYQEYDRTRASAWNHANLANLWIVEERARVIAHLLASHGFIPLVKTQALDIGCGYGGVLAGLIDLGAQPHNLYGIDLLPDRIEAACRAYPEIHFTCGNAEALDFPDGNFDLALLFTVFSSILDDGMAHNVAREVHRVLKPGGAVLWYDFRYNNPWNPHVRGMTKKNLQRHFPGFELHLIAITLLPPLARRLPSSLLPVLYPVLASVPLLCTHYLSLLVKPAKTCA